MEQKLERLNKDQLELKERQKPYPGYHPFKKNKGPKGMVDRFDEDVESKSDFRQLLEFEYEKKGSGSIQQVDAPSVVSSSAQAPVGDSASTGYPVEVQDKKSIDQKNNTLSRFHYLDKHEKVTYGLLQRDLSGREVLQAAEERVGQNLERIR